MKMKASKYSMENYSRSAEKAVVDRADAKSAEHSVEVDAHAAEKLKDSLHSLPVDAEVYEKSLAEHNQELTVEWEQREERLRKATEECENLANQGRMWLDNAKKARAEISRTSMSTGDKKHLEHAEAQSTAFARRVEQILATLEDNGDGFKGFISDASEYYENAERLSRAGIPDNALKDYTGHTVEHITEVKRKLDNCMEQAISAGLLTEHDVLDRSTIAASTAYHDVGNSGGLTNTQILFGKAFHTEYAQLRHTNPSDSDRVQDWLFHAEHHTADDYMEREDIASDGHTYAPELGGLVRRRHAMESGVMALRDRTRLEARGANADQTAFIISLHSKSGYLEGSKPRDLNDLSAIEDAATHFKDECERRGLFWDDGWLKRPDGKYDPEALRKVANTASILRLADASRDGELMTSQQGTRFTIRNEELCIGRKAPVFHGGEKHGELDASRLHEEIEGVDIYLDEATGAKVVNERSRAVIFGEHNISIADFKKDENGAMVWDYHIRDPRMAPGCTAMAIKERLIEIENSTFRGKGVKLRLISDLQGVSAEQITALLG